MPSQSLPALPASDGSSGCREFFRQPIAEARSLVGRERIRSRGRGLDDDGTIVADLRERGMLRSEIGMPVTRREPVGIGNVIEPQPRPRRAQCRRGIGLLDVHVVGIEQQRKIVVADAVEQAQPFLCRPHLDGSRSG